jgi:hypothetical protein
VDRIQQNNLTDEVEEWFIDRQRKLDSFSRVWPIRIATSRTRNLSAIGGPPKGTTQLHLVCGFRDDSKRLCGQTVYILKLGASIYTTDLAAIHQGIARHVGICHMEVIYG